MFRTLPPSGSPISALDLLACMTNALGQPARRLESSLGEYLGTRTAGLFSTGRGAMTHLMKQLRILGAPDGRNTVILPSYTCYSVAASTLNAGLKIRICDITPETLTYDPELLESVKTTDVVAIVSSNLYGIPDDLPFLENFSKQRNLYLIDDAAQALGARIGKRHVGTFGNAGILSFDKGKVITSINGGAIISNDKTLQEAIESDAAGVDKMSVATKLTETAKVVAYSLLLRPHAYWLPANNPMLNLGKTRYDADFRVTEYFARLAPILVRQLRRLGTLNGQRCWCASQYDHSIVETEFVRKVRIRSEAQPIFLRYPIRILSETLREQFLQQHKKNGVSNSYPSALPEVPELRDRVEIHQDQYQNGRKVSREIVTLPTHHYVTSTDIRNICQYLASNN